MVKNISSFLLQPILSVFISFIFFNPITSLYAGDSAVVQILHANSLNIVTQNGVELKKLIGAVKLQHNDAIMDCDMATIDAANHVDAQGNVVIQKGADVTMTGNSLFYDSDIKYAIMRGNVKLRDKKMTLQTNELFYEMTPDKGYYTNKGLVTSADNKIRSTQGVYFAKTKEAYFSQDVLVTNPKFKLKSDSLLYNTETEIAYFYRGTQIFNDSGTIWCRTGWYNTKTNLCAFGANTIVINMPQWLRTDSLYYDKNTGFGRVLKNYDYHDTTLHITLEGDLADYYDHERRVIGYNRPLMTYEQDAKNILYMKADTMFTYEVGGVKQFFGQHRVRMYKDEFQAVADSVYYSQADSTFRLFHEPFVWNDSMQLKGDTIYLLMKLRKPYKAIMLNNALAAEHILGKAFNQIGGNYIDIYFKDSKTDYIFARDNAQCKYYGKEEGKGYQGMNTVDAAEIKGNFKEGKMSRILFNKSPKAVFTPMKKLTAAQFYLGKFVWKEERRPRSKKDL